MVRVRVRVRVRVSPNPLTLTLTLTLTSERGDLGAAHHADGLAHEGDEDEAHLRRYSGDVAEI